MAFSVVSCAWDRSIEEPCRVKGGERAVSAPELDAAERGTRRAAAAALGPDLGRSETCSGGEAWDGRRASISRQAAAFRARRRLAGSLGRRERGAERVSGPLAAEPAEGPLGGTPPSGRRVRGRRSDEPPTDDDPGRPLPHRCPCPLPPSLSLEQPG
ncbi:hypothetical protein CDD83_3100 [Cordyceps sp. RAO-2017]|nr:hypothetical protein CDD83_3100 [Cordyceps sp. RAO-2017]